MCATRRWPAASPTWTSWSTPTSTPPSTRSTGPTAAAAGQVGRVILVTSAIVYGARPDNPVPLEETAPLRADPDGSVAGDLLEIEHLARRSPRVHPGLSVTVVRP